MDQSNLSKAELIVLGSASAQLPKAKYTPTPEHLAKLTAARLKYQADVKAGIIKPAARTPKPVVIEAPKFDTVNTGLDLHAPVTFYNTKTRWEFLVKDGNFNRDPIPFLYIHRARVEGKFQFEVENPAGDFLSVNGKWVHHKRTDIHFVSLPHVYEVLQKLNINLVKDFTM